MLLFLLLVAASLGGAEGFAPKRMPPPSGPSRRHNRAVAGAGMLLTRGAVLDAKRLVPGGPNPLHN